MEIGDSFFELLQHIDNQQVMKIEEKTTSDAEETVKFAIFSGIVDTWYLQNPEKTRDAIFKKLFEPHLKWAVQEYLNEIK